MSREREEVVTQLSEDIIEKYSGDLLDWIYACLTQYPGQVRVPQKWNFCTLGTTLDSEQCGFLCSILNNEVFVMMQSVNDLPEGWQDQVNFEVIGKDLWVKVEE